MLDSCIYCVSDLSIHHGRGMKLKSILCCSHYAFLAEFSEEVEGDCDIITDIIDGITYANVILMKKGLMVASSMQMRAETLSCAHFPHELCWEVFFNEDMSSWKQARFETASRSSDIPMSKVTPYIDLKIPF